MNLNDSCILYPVYILSRATYQRAPRYGGVRTWVEGPQARGNRALAEVSNLLYKLYLCQKRTQLLNTKA